MCTMKTVNYVLRNNSDNNINRQTQILCNSNAHTHARTKQLLQTSIIKHTHITSERALPPQSAFRQKLIYGARIFCKYVIH